MHIQRPIKQWLPCCWNTVSWLSRSDGLVVGNVNFCRSSLGVDSWSLEIFSKWKPAFCKIWMFYGTQGKGMDAKNDLIYSWTSFPSLVVIHSVGIGCNWESSNHLQTLFHTHSYILWYFFTLIPVFCQIENGFIKIQSPPNTLQKTSSQTKPRVWESVRENKGPASLKIRWTFFWCNGIEPADQGRAVKSC